MKFLLASALTILASANAASLPDCQVQEGIDGYTACSSLMGSTRGGNDALYCVGLEDCMKVFPDPVFEVVEEVEEEFEVSALYKFSCARQRSPENFDSISSNINDMVRRKQIRISIVELVPSIRTIPVLLALDLFFEE